MLRSINPQTTERSKLAKAGNLLSSEIAKYLFAHSIRIQHSAVFQSIILLSEQISNSMMARKLTSQEVSLLFERKLSERSGLVKNVRSAEFILREYETATVTKTAKEPLSRKRKITINLACSIKN